MSFFKQMRNVAKKIPKGKVTTYGLIAQHLGTRDARLVGWAMHGNTDPRVPCHRVVKKDGSVAERYSIGGWQEQKRRLLAEGVKFVNQKRVNLKNHLWFPTSNA